MCKLDKLLLYSYEDNSINPLEKIIVEEHLKYCNECRNELKEIREFEENINHIDFEDIELPDDLDELCSLVIDNCISKENYNKNISSSYKEEIKLLKSSIKNSYKLRYNNPYNKAIKKNINGGREFIKKTAKKYCKDKFEKSKISKSALYKILKAV